MVIEHLACLGIPVRHPNFCKYCNSITAGPIYSVYGTVFAHRCATAWSLADHACPGIPVRHPNSCGCTAGLIRSISSSMEMSWPLSFWWYALSNQRHGETWNWSICYFQILCEIKHSLKSNITLMSWNNYALSDYYKLRLHTLNRGYQYILTHWGRVTHTCVGNLTSIGSDNGLLPGRRQAIIWINAGILLIGLLGTNFSEILIGIQTFPFKKMHSKMPSGK